MVMGLVTHSVLKGGASEKVLILGEPMVLSCQFGSENRRSKWSPSIFGLSAHFYGQKLPQKAINEAYWAISRPGVSNLADPGGSRLDLGGIHPGGCVTAFKPIQKCHKEALEGPKMAPKSHK